MQTTLPNHEIVLLGVGHTNAHVLRMWRMAPLPDARLTCISNFPVATYSGMMPGVLARQYQPERMQIDLVRLCAAAGSRLLVGHVTGIDVDRREVLFDDRPPVPFDVLSVGVGSVPDQSGVDADGTLLPIKPMQTFLDRLDARLAGLAESCRDRAVRITVVGMGVGGVEVTFCLPERIRSLLGEVSFELTLVGGGDQVAEGTRPATQAIVRKELERRGVSVRTNSRVTGVRDGQVVLADGERFGADLVLWAVSAVAAPLLSNIGLPKDDQGFLLTRSTLQTTADAPIFAVGDTGTIDRVRTPKAGVYAVRQGPVLWDNLRRSVEGRPLVEFTPQRGFLKLMNTGNGRAVAEYKGLSFSGRWCWKLKDWIDSRFMDKYQDYGPMEMTAGDNADSRPAMRCAGCGGKVGGSVLSRVLARLEIPHNEHVLLGLDRPDDAAIVASPEGRPLTVTADFFQAPLDDAYLVGRIAALNAASDAFALGAQPIAALALVTVPVGKPRIQEQLLYELLAGSLHEFRRMDATLAGGHTIEGSDLTIGFTVLADQRSQPARTKADMRPGELLVLTKPLGTGILLAAHMRALCKAEWMQPLLDAMLASNRDPAAVAEQHQVAAMTDVTGFGLAGHLLEMLEASDVACELRLDELPLLPGTAELIDQDVESTLAPANRAAEAAIDVSEAKRTRAAYSALFDPQTSGGLLLSVPEERVDAVLQKLHGQSPSVARVIGRTLPKDQTERRIRII